MKHKILEKIQIPNGISCDLNIGLLKCKKDSLETTRKINIPEVKIKIEDNFVIFECDKGNKKKYKTIMSNVAHIKNIFSGLQEKFVYKLEACNVHFPMSLKVDSNKLIITNFLGEKTPRHAEILPNVNVAIKGQEIIVSSSDKEAASQTAANFERATKIKSKDRRVFLDGIFIVQKPEREKNEKVHQTRKF